MKRNFARLLLTVYEMKLLYFVEGPCWPMLLIIPARESSGGFTAEDNCRRMDFYCSGDEMFIMKEELVSSLIGRIKGNAY